ncbi:hypothetical protein CAPTEDRAFT_142920 [Capitella teleta]|uniref:Fatty acyl-CoA reductase n=1 Tax=Capitella teleta TaxID=283909 RepID=R7V8C2_CAPTE|nr:hypothetical protein CAPTEDRAFT_142920 [Capitella teleta]|eukprot:ELU15103.1 hypothetical protein CAPTEDRAFT_142920 [Capitella teleta]
MSASIPEFYRDRSVFLTGASGFLGKQILEKLLRSCNVRCVYVLVRQKRGKTSEERKELLLKSEIFADVKMVNPNFGSKIKLISGEMTSPEMGLTEEDKEQLRKEVSVVIHSAASVNFTEKLKDAVSINVIALQHMIRLSKSFPKLESFVHISTAYVHCYKDYIPEAIVKPNHDPNTIIDLVLKESEQRLEELTPKLMHPWPNTYTFSKCLAEWLLHEEADDFPCCIMRPAVIGAAAEEPRRGWVDNFNAASGMMAGVAGGLLNPVYGDPDIVADVVPVDLCANITIALGWSTAVTKPATVPVYNFTSNKLNPLTWGEFEYWLIAYFNRCPLNANTGMTKIVVAKNRFRQVLLDYGVNRVKVIIFDLMLRMSGKKPRLLQLHKKAMKGANVLEYFITHQWSFETENVTSFYEKLNAEDRKNFNFDIKQVNWEEYMVHYCKGIKQYAMKEDFKNISQKRKLQRRYSYLC